MMELVRRKVVLSLCGLLLFTAGCSDKPTRPEADSGSASSTGSGSRAASAPTSEPALGSPTTIGLLPEQANCALGSSPAIFDAAHGTYAVYLTGIDPGSRTLSFDVIQFLVGDQAAEAYHREEPQDPSGPPNDYFIVNESPQTYSSVVAPAVRVRLVRLSETGDASLKPGTFDELPAYLSNPQYRPPDSNALSGFPYWLTIEDSQVVDICEQYRP